MTSHVWDRTSRTSAGVGKGHDLPAVVGNKRNESGRTLCNGAPLFSVRAPLTWHSDGARLMSQSTRVISGTVE
eukprot:8442949-Pyramimonas_sp.AAC.1